MKLINLGSFQRVRDVVLDESKRRLINELNVGCLKVDGVKYKVESCGDRLNVSLLKKRTLFSPQEKINCRQVEKCVNLTKFLGETDRVRINKFLKSSAKCSVQGDKQRAEYFCEKAVALACGGVEVYQRYKQQISDKSVMKKMRDEARNMINLAKNSVNEIANKLMLCDPNFSKDRFQFIVKCIQNSVSFPIGIRDLDYAIMYRSVRVNGSYGSPASVFHFGMSPQFVGVWEFQGLTNNAYINDAAKYDENNEVTGWSGGVTSATTNLKFAAQFEYAKKYGQQDGYIYAFSVKDAFSVAEAITVNTGFTGKNESNASAAEEFAIPFVKPECVLGARPITRDGKIGPFIPNPNFKSSASGDKEFIKYLYSESVEDLENFDETNYPNSIAQDFRKYFIDSRAPSVDLLGQNHSEEPRRYVKKEQ